MAAETMRAVRFDGYGGIEVLRVAEVERPVPGPGQVLVKVVAAAINPGEAAIRLGVLHDRWPATFPSGQGSDLAGVVLEVGDGVEGFAAGDEVFGFTDNRASHAEYVVTEAADLLRRPPEVPWEQAASLHVAGTTAYGEIRAVGLRPGDTVVIAGAAGGVGTIATQLAVNAGATVIGLASEPNHQWLREHGAVPIAYGEGVAERIKAAAGHVDAFIDNFGGGYVDLALELGVSVERINTIIDLAAVERHGVKFEGNAAGATVEVLAELAELVRTGRLEVPIAATYPLDRVQDAFRELEKRHTRGKIVLKP
ncbi:NADP-dependent oxidoreductase [Nonomuraea jabiensis]|uniref:NADPH:quinone reductase-like Zn-dependent oxidoreductase n=1 Tax=Nonomuraea jabiensis TaxID=882448 RepID=A0A7W9L7H9_9ACTN|nr:NADP-dependent oxidoreductase [Nonomuraea jabiensis]MBB5773444.1 NADPH:quinone reductase-like Zn-dependent oxidoreductase [Nonomuraea jabiensis]